MVVVLCIWFPLSWLEMGACLTKGHAAYNCLCPIISQAIDTCNCEVGTWESSLKVVLLLMYAFAKCQYSSRPYKRRSVVFTHVFSMPAQKSEQKNCEV